MKKRYLAALTLIAFSGISMLLFKESERAFFPAYRNISKTWIFVLSNLMSFSRVAIWDIAALALALSFIISLILVIVKRKNVLSYFSYVTLIAAVLIFLAVDGWMLNHYAPKLKDELSLNVREYSFDELYETTKHYFDEAAKYAVEMERDAEGHVVQSDFYELASIAGSSYEQLEEAYPIFKGSNKPVKKLSLIGEYLMYNGIVGMFMPITGEAGVPASVPIVPMPFTMAHEAGHRLGLAAEQEANFAAFLACISNKDVRFIYSGYYNAFSYCFSALYRSDPDKARELYNSESERGYELIRLDRLDTSKVYASYESPLQEVSDQINDTYLKTFSQEEGIRSYGLVTDYLIAWYLEKR